VSLLPSGRRRRGNVIIEFAVTFPLLLAFLSGMYQFGYAFFVYNQLQSAVRTGARYGSTTDFDGGSGGSNFQGRVRNVVVYGSPTGGSVAHVKGLATSNVNVVWTADGAGIPQTITVSISNFSYYAVFRTFTAPNKPRATFLYLGQFISG